MIIGSPNRKGVAWASTYNQRGVMTPMPNDTSLGFTRWILIVCATYGFPLGAWVPAAEQSAHEVRTAIRAEGEWSESQLSLGRLWCQLLIRFVLKWWLPVT